MDSIVTKRLIVASALIIGFLSACGSDDPPGKPGPTGTDGGTSGPPKTLLCTSDAECDAEKPFCDPYSGCAECLFNAQCAEGSHCVENECVVPTTCFASEECDEENPVCNTIIGECVGCVSDTDCTEEEVCQVGRCTEVTRCVNTLDCAEGEVCERSLGYCVQCVGDADCGEESACVENSCILRCDSDNDCRAGNLLCDAVAGHCVECVEHADCPDVYNCRSGRCVVDECMQGTATCTSQYEFTICNETGSGTVSDFCPSQSTCTLLTPAEVHCSPWICIPGDSTCGGDGASLTICDEDGQDYSEVMDCAAAGGICENGACTEVVCDAGARFCDAGVLYQCAASGTSFTALQACGSTEFCNEAVGMCSAQVCTPGARTCEGTLVRECNSEGSELTDVSDCSDDEEACLDGQCVPKVCTPGETACNEDKTAVLLCDAVGSSFTVSTTCLTTSYCDDETTTCRVHTCNPGALLCEGEVATTCNELGSGVESDGTDCSDEDNQACYGGACLPRICTGTYYCKDGHSYDCLQNGTADSIDDTCSSTQFCNAATGRCASQVCEPDSVGCVDNAPAVCNADGSGYDTDAPCDEDEACVSGTCLPVICAANTYYCEGQAIYDCGSDGTTTSLVTTCAENRYCEEGASSCRTDVCVAGEPVCNGASVSVCKADGSGPEDGGTACASSKICEDGACADIVCTANESFCEDNTVNLCNELGTGIEDTTSCSDAQFCNDTVTPVICSADICEAGEPSCDGEIPATCKSNGGGYTNRDENCADTGEVCNGNQCVDAANDTVGSDASSTSVTSYRFANRYYITSARTLTTIQQYLSVSGTSQFTWFVYEGTTSSSFTKIFETLNTSSGAAMFHSSGAISVPLVKGRYYMIGVRVTGDATWFYTTPSGAWVSFGQQTGSDYTSSSSTLPSTWSVSADSIIWHQKLTTELP